MMDKLISQQAAIDAVAKWIFEVFGIKESDGTATVFKRLRELPSAQPETNCSEIPNNCPAADVVPVVRCKDCKHWNPQFKTANGNGLGSCDFHNVALVTSEGFCYWAEKRGEADE